MPDAQEQFFAHSRRIPEMVALDLSEADTRAHAIDPVLRILGYHDVGDIRREVPIPATREFIDYALLVAGQPQVLVEAKALRHPVTDQHLGQCVSYAAMLGIEWCVITNGKVWVVCNAHAKGPLEAKRVAEVALGGDELQTEVAWKTLSLLSRDSLMQANPLGDLLVDRVLIDELTRGDSPVVAALRKAVRDRFATSVPPQAILNAVRRLSNARTEPSRGAPAEPTVRGAEIRPARKSQARTGEAAGRVTLATLVSAGIVQEDDPVEARLYGVTHVGRVRNGGIEVNGIHYPTPSAAASALRGGKASNGWVIWTHRGRLLGKLRLQLESNATAPGNVG